MDHQHTRMMYQNLAAVGNYAHQMLAKLSRGAGELPQWTNHILSTVRTHVGDVTHYLRHEDAQGRQYGMSGRGMSPWYGQAGLEPSGENKRPVPDGWGQGNASQLEVQASREGRSVGALERQYGVPGRPFGTPGWYGQGGVATVDSGFLAGSRQYGAHGRQGSISAKMGAERSSITRSYAGHHEPASMARKNLREIEAYAKEARAHFKKDAGIAPAWVEHKLSMAASQMDAMGHWLENEAVEGRQYGSHLSPTPGDAGDEPHLYGYADGIGGEYRGANWEGHPFGRKIYDDAYRKGQTETTLPNIKAKRAYFYGRADGLRETYLGHLWDDTLYEDDYDRGWREGFGVEPKDDDDDGRQYGARGGRGGGPGGAGGGGRPGGGGGGGARRGGPGRGPGRGGPGPGAHPRSLGPANSGHIPDRHRRGKHWKKHQHRGDFHPVWGFWAPWSRPYEYYEDIHLGEPEPVVHVREVYAHTVAESLLPQISDSTGVIGMKGSGFSAIDRNFLRLRFSIDGQWHEDDAPIVGHTDTKLEIVLPISRNALNKVSIGDVGYYEGDQLISIGHSFFQAAGGYPYKPFNNRKYGVERIEILKGQTISKKQLGRTYAGNLAAKFENYQAPFRNYGLSTDQKFEGDSPPLQQHSQAEGIRRYGRGTPSPKPTGGGSSTGIFQSVIEIPATRGGRTDTGIFTGEVILTGSPPTMGRKRTKKAFRRYGGAISGVGGVESMTLAEVVNMEAPMGYANRPWRSLQVGMGPVQEYGSMGYGSMGDGSMDQSVQGAKKQITRGAMGVLK